MLDRSRRFMGKEIIRALVTGIAIDSAAIACSRL
jgi:hypothetical protein